MAKEQKTFRQQARILSLTAIPEQEIQIFQQIHFDQKHPSKNMKQSEQPNTQLPNINDFTPKKAPKRNEVNNPGRGKLKIALHLTKISENKQKQIPESELSLAKI